MDLWKWALVIRKISSFYRIIELSNIAYQNRKLQGRSFKLNLYLILLDLMCCLSLESVQKREAKLKRIHHVKEKKVNRKVQNMRNLEVIREIVKSSNGCKNASNINQRFKRKRKPIKLLPLLQGKLKMKKLIKRRQRRPHREQIKNYCYLIET